MSTESRPKTITNPKSCFLNLSYTSGSSPSRIERIITDYFRGRGFEVKTGRMAPGGEPNDCGILQVIKSCSFGIVVYNEFRHNIGYEWGIMDALGMPVIPFKDKNTHIDLDKDFSDKKGINFVHYSGDSDEKDIIKELENSDSLKNALENVEKRIRESISPEETDEAKEASRILTESNIPLGEKISVDKERLENPDIDKTLDVMLSKVRKLTSEGHFYRAIAYQYANDFENAEKEYKKAISINPAYWEVHNNLGSLLYSLDRYEEAENELKGAIKINPYDGAAHNNLGVLLRTLKRYGEAEKEYRLVIKMDSHLFSAHYNLGVLLDELKRYDEAEKEFREAIKLNPDFELAHSELGALLYSTKRCKEAEKELKEAIKLNPNNTNAHFNLGNLLLYFKRYDEVEKEFRKIIEIDYDDAEVHNNLAALLSQVGKKGEAKKEFEIAKRLFEVQGRKKDAKKIRRVLKLHFSL